MNIIEAARQVQKSGGTIRLIESGRFCPVASGHVPIDVPHILSDDWEYVPPPPKPMAFMEAVAAMREGKKVRRLGSKDFSCSKEGMLNLFLYDIEQTDWVVVEEGGSDE